MTSEAAATLSYLTLFQVPRTPTVGLFNWFIYSVSKHVCVHKCHGTHVEVRGQPPRLHSPSTWGLNSGCQGGQQVPSVTEQASLSLKQL